MTDQKKQEDPVTELLDVADEAPVSMATSESPAAPLESEEEEWVVKEDLIMEIPAVEIPAEMPSDALSDTIQDPFIETPIETPSAEIIAAAQVADETVLAAAAPDPETPPQMPMISFIEDPYQIKTLEVAEAQNQDEDIDLDLDDSEEPAELQEIQELDEPQLERLVQAMAEVEAEASPVDAQTAEIEATQSAANLAAQIAEDEALAKHLAEQDELAENADEELKAALPTLPEADENGALDLSELESCIEALLFMADKPLSVEKLKDLLGPDFPLPLFQEAMTALCDRYRATNRGIEIVKVAGGYQFRTKPGRAALARKLAKVQTQRLSSGAMETLAIVAYRQPVMKEDIDKIRGVDSSYFIRGLLDKKLIKISGRSELPGRPMLYSTTHEFLELFGLDDLSSMPSLHEIEKMIPASQSANPDDPANEDPRVKEMRRLVGEMKSDTSTTLNYDPREDERILKEIREKVQSIPTSTPYLDEQKAIEKEQAALAQQQIEQPSLLPPSV